VSHLPFTLLAYFLNAFSVTVDKFLISKHIPDPLIYTFYLSVVSFVALLLIPLAPFPPLPVFFLTSTATLLWTTGAYFLFRSLKEGHLSRVIPIIGTLVPLILLSESAINKSLTQNQFLAVVILIFGIIFLTYTDIKGEITLRELLFEAASALFFAVSYIILRQAYLMGDFWSVFVWGRPVLIPVGIVLLVIPQTRKIIFPYNPENKTASHRIKANPLLKLFKTKVSLLFIVGQFSAGISELLLIFSISLASPALVNSLQGSQFAFIFIMNAILSKFHPEIFKAHIGKVAFITKVIGTLLLGIGLYLLAFN
jgi:uncharacterized membrane protein